MHPICRAHIVKVEVMSGMRPSVLYAAILSCKPKLLNNIAAELCAPVNIQML